MTIRKVEGKATTYYIADTEEDSDRLITVMDMCGRSGISTELNVYPNLNEPRNPYFVFLLVTLQGNDIELFARAIEYLKINYQTSHQSIKRVKNELRQKFVRRFEGRGKSDQSRGGGKRKRGLGHR